jgi:hypothetical protein
MFIVDTNSVGALAKRDRLRGEARTNEGEGGRWGSTGEKHGERGERREAIRGG